jgi:aminoglycoside phosphotransferase (APT) family kinase protein
MEHRCEVCESFRPRGDLGAARELLEVPFGERSVLLCRGHAGIAKNSGVATLDELRALYAESHGQRSYIARRARIAPSNAGSARSAGRRANDFAR